MTLVEKLKEGKSEEVIKTAIETLTERADIRQFYQDYVSYLRQNGDTEQVRKNPEEFAASNIKEFLPVDHNYKTIDRWILAVPIMKQAIYGFDTL